MIVVYKVDRLARSLADFAKLVELFDAHGVSFISVTQAFNTTTSMGRLTLNMLLSFAQFEREITGERIRDKVAASKRKGIWMGGAVPLGYRIEDRALHVVEQEAEFVRSLFATGPSPLRRGALCADRRRARRRAAPHGLGLALWPVLFGLVALVIATLGVPLGMIVFWLMQHADAATSPIGVSLDLLARSAAASLEFGAAAALLTLALALPLGFLAARYQGWQVMLLERAAYLAQGMPAIVVALALVSLTVHALRPLYQSATALVIAYSILFLPLALVSVRAVLMQTQPVLEEAGLRVLAGCASRCG